MSVPGLDEERQRTQDLRNEIRQHLATIENKDTEIQEEKSRREETENEIELQAAMIHNLRKTIKKQKKEITSKERLYRCALHQ